MEKSKHGKPVVNAVSTHSEILRLSQKKSQTGISSSILGQHPRIYMSSIYIQLLQPFKKQQGDNFLRLVARMTLSLSRLPTKISKARGLRFVFMKHDPFFGAATQLASAINVTKTFLQKHRCADRFPLPGGRFYEFYEGISFLLLLAKIEPRGLLRCRPRWPLLAKGLGLVKGSDVKHPIHPQQNKSISESNKQTKSSSNQPPHQFLCVNNSLVPSLSMLKCRRLV